MTRLRTLLRGPRLVLFVLLLATTALLPLVRARALGPAGGQQVAPVTAPVPIGGHAIEAVFVLDTTGSMSGLLEGAKRKIWSIADAMAGGSPGVPLRIGLVAYRDRGDDYVTRRYDLTEDLDAIWGHLRELEAAGGGDTPESVNQALDEAVTKLSWSEAKGVYRVIFLVGDAPPHLDYPQDVGFAASAAAAKRRDIVINTVQCGSLPDTTPVWQEIARIGLGQFAAIDQGGAMVALSTPLDDELAALNRRLADTVVPYGAAAEQAELREKISRSLDAAPEAAASRLSFMAKRGGKTNLGRSDLVDAAAAGEVDVKKLPEAALPEPLKALPPEERQQLIDQKTEERKDLQTKIAALGAKRETYLKEQESKLRAEGKLDGFDQKVMDAVKAQKAAKGIL